MRERQREICHKQKGRRHCDYGGRLFSAIKQGMLTATQSWKKRGVGSPEGAWAFQHLNVSPGKLLSECLACRTVRELNGGVLCHEVCGDLSRQP